jgi:hypothetical protein
MQRLAIGVLAVCVLAAGCGERSPTSPEPAGVEIDQSNLPVWDGAWTAIGRGSTVVRLAQTVTPQKSRLTAVGIDLLTANRGRGGDEITVRIVEGDRVLATSSQSVPEGHDGLLLLEFPSPGIGVTPGTAFQLQVEDTGKEVFGWRYGLNVYAGGVAYLDGVPWNNGAFDFRFRTSGY